MSGAVSITGSLIQAPTGGDCGFPSGVNNIVFGTFPSQKPAAVSFGAAPNVNSPNSYATLVGLGAGGPVTQGNFLYLRTVSPMLIRVTTFGAPDVVAIVPVQGLCILEFDSTRYLKLLEVQGVGAVEYFASGNQ